MSPVTISEATTHLSMALCFSLALGNFPSFASVQAMRIAELIPRLDGSGPKGWLGSN